MRDIDLVYKDNSFCIPNAWEKLTPEQYQHLVDNLLLLSAGELSSDGCDLLENRIFAEG